jgi:hypothetical protein
MRFSARSKLGIILSLVTILTVVSSFMVMAIANRGMGAHAAASQSLPTGGLTFASTPTSAHFSKSVVTAAGKGTSGVSVAINETATLTKWPKGYGPASIHGNSGVTGGSDATGTGRSTPGTTSSFIGQQGSATTCSYFAQGCNPPDMALAASPSFVLQGVNTSWEVLDTSGNVVSGPVSAQNFFGVPNEPDNCDLDHGNQPFLSDPRALYDPADGRFWAAMLQIEGSAAFGVAQNCPYKSSYWIAVSQTSNPTGAWNVYEFNMETDVAGQQFGADYTQIGINSQAVYFSGNMFGEQGGFFAELFEANKAQMESGGTSFTADGFYNLRVTAGPGITGQTGPFLADTVQPTLNLDNSNGTTETFLDTVDGPDVQNGHFCGFFGGGFDQACSGLLRWDMANPVGHDSGGAAPTLTGSYVATAPFLVSNPADEPTCNQCVDVLDLRITATPVIRNGTAYAAWETATQRGSHVLPGIEWGAVNLSNNSSTTDYYSRPEAVSFGTLMPDASGNLTMLFEHMGSNVFPETRYVTKPAGEKNFVSGGKLLKAGESSYRPTLCGTSALPVCRWGDFEAASFDGAGHIWFAGEYANQFQGVTTQPAFGRNWGTWMGAIAAS